VTTHKKRDAKHKCIGPGSLLRRSGARSSTALVSTSLPKMTDVSPLGFVPDFSMRGVG
jgi:hypothetical protein